MSKPRSPRKQFGNFLPKARQPDLWGKDVLSIERMSQEGRGVARRAGKIVFVSGALVGEQVRVQCTAVKRDYDEAEMIVLMPDTVPSVQRVQPECPVYEQCGGCSLQHWALAAQQQHKQANVSAMLRSIDPALMLDPPIVSAQSGFRHRLRLLVTRTADRRYALGLRRRRSHAPVNLQHCLVANAAINRLLQVLPDMLLRAPDLQGLREIEIDVDSNKQLGLCFYFAAHPGEKTLSELRTAMLVESVSAVRVRLNTQKKPPKDLQFDESGSESTAQWQELLVHGELCLRLAVATENGGSVRQGLELAYLPGDFTQTHWEINAALVDCALDWLRPHHDETALDLFSGIGNFSLPLSLFAKTVLAVEGDSGMAARILANAKRNGIENVSAMTLNLLADEVALPKADIAIVDPPRAGAKAVCAALARSRVQRLLYVSCHPATLARDARVLHDGGLRVSKAAVVDMFPHTGHAEVMVLFERH